MPARRLALFFAVLMLSAAIPRLVCAQSSVFASLSGRVTDPSDAVVPDVVVTLVNAGTNERLQVVSDAVGRYVFTRVTPGQYRLEAERAGFQRAAIESLTVAVNDALTRDLQLQAGDVSETVAVIGTGGVVQTRTADVSLVVDARNAAELPLNGKNWARLIALAPGAGLGSGDSSVSGARSLGNVFSVDGLGAGNERASGLPVGGGASAFTAAPSVISAEAVQEFRVITSNADATFGHGSGSQVNLITRSGTNRITGSAYEFMRDDALDARDFFNSGPFFDERGRPVVPPFSQHLFGATAGGPIRRDRHFFFASYEGFRQQRELTSSLTVPNSDLLALIPGDLGRLMRGYYLDRGLVQSTTSPGELRALTAADRAAAIAAGFDASLFDGNAANGEAGTLLQSTTVPQDVEQDAFLLRTDHVLSPGWRVSGRYGAANPAQTGPQNTPLDRLVDSRRWQSVVGEVIGVVSPSQVVELRGGFQRTEHAQRPPDGVGEAFRALGVRDDLGILVNATGTGLSSTGLLGSIGFLDNQNMPQLSVLHTWQRGRLTLRSGLDVARYAIDIHNGAGRVSYTFTGFAGPNGILGASPSQATPIATSAAASIFGANGGPTTALRHFTSSRQEYFTQADVRATAGLTVNLGVRYSYYGVYSETNGAIANLFATDASGAIVDDVPPFHFGRTSNIVAPAADGRALYRPDRNNWQPRVGIAWDISGRGTTALRAAYGAYDDRMMQLLFSAQGGLVNNRPFTVASNASNLPFTLGGALPVVAGTPSVFGLDPTIRSPRVHRVNAGVEHELWPSMSVTAAYVGAFGRGLYGVADVNGGSGVPQTSRPDTRYSTERVITNTSASDYHALQVLARQRLRGGLSFTAAYTLASAHDDSSAETFAIFPGLINTGASTAPGFHGGGVDAWIDRPRDADWGPTAGISRHTLVASHLLELPFGRDRRWLSGAAGVVNGLVSGWALSGVLSVRSGEAVDLRLGADANDDGDAADRPALLGGSLDDLYARGGDKTQFLVSRDRAAQLLGAPASATDPFAVVGRNPVWGPPIWFYDLSLAKRTPLSSRIVLSLELNAFNLFNHTNLAAPIATLSDARFGRIVSTAVGTTPRQIQLGMKVTF